MLSDQFISSTYNALLASNNKHGKESSSSSSSSSSSLSSIVLLSFWKFIKDTLCSHIENRKKWQKVEFISCWIFAFSLVFFKETNAGEVILNNDQNIHDIILETATSYIQFSIFTRLLAYAVDFANADKKLGTLPSWLILHHTGVVAIHSLTAFFFSQSNSKTILYMLALQSTQNTWTKKYSLMLYWGNVLLGVMTTLIFTTSNIMDDKVELSWGLCLCMMMAIGTTIVGIMQLFGECKQKK